MKSVFDVSTREELLNRISALSPESKAHWGKMNAFQMLKHCTLCDDLFLGNIKIKRVFIGRLIGKAMLKKVLKDETPFSKHSPTSSLLVTTKDSGSWEEQKEEWRKRLDQYANYNNFNFVHPFFGPMTKEQVGFFAYKHSDHHLRQFGG